MAENLTDTGVEEISNPELDYHALNAQLNLYDANGKIQFDADRKAARQYFLQHVNQNTVFFHDLEEKMEYLDEIGEESLKRRALQEYQAVLLKLYYNVRRYYPSEKSILRMLSGKMKKNYNNVIRAREVALGAKILYCVGAFAPYFTGKLIDKMI